MSNRNKNKGKSYERILAKHLTDVFQLNFERVPNSGAFVGGKNITRASRLTEGQLLASSGDIIVPNELKHVDFECKFYKTFAFNSLLNNCEVLNTWIEQAESTVKSLWFLFIKINHKGEFIVFDKKHNKLYNKLDNYLVYKNKYIFIEKGEFLTVFKQEILNNDTTM